MIKLLENYHSKYPECVYIPPKMIPTEEVNIVKRDDKCRLNFRRGWIMGTNWAKLFYMNNHS